MSLLSPISFRVVDGERAGMPRHTYSVVFVPLTVVQVKSAGSLRGGVGVCGG